MSLPLESTIPRTLVRGRQRRQESLHQPYHRNPYRHGNGQLVVMQLAVLVSGDDPGPRQIHSQTPSTCPDRHPQPHQGFSTHPTLCISFGRHQATQACPFHPPTTCCHLPILVRQPTVNSSSQGREESHRGPRSRAQETHCERKLHRTKRDRRVVVPGQGREFLQRMLYIQGGGTGSCCFCCVQSEHLSDRVYYYSCAQVVCHA